eukprot:TRINITY_DN23622_c0_g1_i1.p3 TRINITY_DN23622_c0_g1~~TRINITY_DN23622_c0_g1_i1.p3  ORF type:complete len:58 (+),score=1.40 TRINITY_DN23622_c0_g1_i1:243-416(+)
MEAYRFGGNFSSMLFNPAKSVQKNTLPISIFGIMAGLRLVISDIAFPHKRTSKLPEK